jgi:hypothetical protein
VCYTENHHCFPEPARHCPSPASLIKATPHRVGVSHEAHVSHPVGPGSASRALDGELVVNRLLAALPGGDFDRIARSLRAVPVVLGQVVQRDGEPVDTLYFPNGCVLSVTTVMDDGSMVEIATVGREGLANITALLHDGAAVGETMIQVASGGLFALPIDAFRTEIERDGLFCQLLTRYAQAFLFQGMRAPRPAMRCMTSNIDVRAGCWKRRIASAPRSSLSATSSSPSCWVSTDRPSASRLAPYNARDSFSRGAA